MPAFALQNVFFFGAIVLPGGENIDFIDELLPLRDKGQRLGGFLAKIKQRGRQVAMKRTISCISGVLLSISFGMPAQSAPPQPAPAAPAERTVTAKLKPTRPKRVAELHYNDAQGRICVDSWQIEASRAELHAGDSIVFRVRSARRCDGKTEKAPQAARAVWNIRGAQGKKTPSDKTETILPQSPSFSFSHVFESPGSYVVTVQNRVDDLEVHTIGMNIAVTERPAYVVEPQSAE